MVAISLKLFTRCASPGTGLLRPAERRKALVTRTRSPNVRQRENFRECGKVVDGARNGYNSYDGLEPDKLDENILWVYTKPDGVDVYENWFVPGYFAFVVPTTARRDSEAVSSRQSRP